eukprot:scaffold7991_cov106-Isochrysis_galbana.AAC.8
MQAAGQCRWLVIGSSQSCAGEVARLVGWLEGRVGEPLLAHGRTVALSPFPPPATLAVPFQSCPRGNLKGLVHVQPPRPSPGGSHVHPASGGFTRGLLRATYTGTQDERGVQRSAPASSRRGPTRLKGAIGHPEPPQPSAQGSTAAMHGKGAPTSLEAGVGDVLETVRLQNARSGK